MGGDASIGECIIIYVCCQATSSKTWHVCQSNIEPKLYNKTKQKQVSAKGQYVGLSRRMMILKTIFGKEEISIGDGEVE
jgi:hypothetical protein